MKVMIWDGFHLYRAQTKACSSDETCENQLISTVPMSKKEITFEVTCADEQAADEMTLK